MTARQPRTPQEAAALDPMGLLSFPAPSQRGLFGASTRRRPPFQIGTGSLNYGADNAGQVMDMTGSPPPISAAPPPPTNWPDLIGDLPLSIGQVDPYANHGIGAGSGVNGQKASALQGEVLPPLPPRRGGIFGASAQTPQGEMPSTIGGQARAAAIGGGMQRGASRMADTLGDAIPKKKGGFDWRFAAGILGDALGSLNGQAPMFAQNMWKLRQQQADHRDRMEQMREQTRLKLSEPDYATVNNRRVRINPTTGESEVLYTAPQDFEDYATSLGAEPGTPEFDRMVQDYVLRGSGPTATDNYNVREDWRQENREELEGIRQNNRIGLQTHRQAGQRALKAVPTYRQANPTSPRSQGRSGGSGSIPEGATATGPGGAKMIRRGGKWVDLK
jgi:hypothetical protein